MVDPFVAALSMISSSLNISKHIKDLVDSSKKDIENRYWSTYINSQHTFKISWPSHRWSIAEVNFSPLPNVITPVLLQSTATKSVPFPHIFIEKKEKLDTLPLVAITIDPHGDLGLEKYIRIMFDEFTNLYSKVGVKYEGNLVPSISNEKILITNATCSYRQTRESHIYKVIKNNGKIYNLGGRIINGIQNHDVLLADMTAIINSVSISS